MAFFITNNFFCFLIVLKRLYCFYKGSTVAQLIAYKTNIWYLESSHVTFLITLKNKPLRTKNKRN